MNFWQKFWKNPYKWGLWKWIGGRPWTFIMRDFAYQNPILVLFIGFALGMVLRPYMEIEDLWKFFTGLLIAHLFWGTKYRKGQQGK